MRRRTRGNIAAVLARMCVACAMLAGCGGPPKAPIAASERAWPDARPADFVLVAVVLTPVVPARELVRWPRAMRPGRYHVEPGGVLRASQVATSTVSALPPIARTLNADQLNQVWRLVRAGGLLDSPEATLGAVPALESRTLDSRVSVASIECVADGRRRVVQVELDRSTTEAIGAERLIEQLAELSWMKP